MASRAHSCLEVAEYAQVGFEAFDGLSGVLTLLRLGVPEVVRGLVHALHDLFRKIDSLHTLFAGELVEHFQLFDLVLVGASPEVFLQRRTYRRLNVFGQAGQGLIVDDKNLVCDTQHRRCVVLCRLIKAQVICVLGSAPMRSIHGACAERLV